MVKIHYIRKIGKLTRCGKFTGQIPTTININKITCKSCIAVLLNDLKDEQYMIENQIKTVLIRKSHLTYEKDYIHIEKNYNHIEE